LPGVAHGSGGAEHGGIRELPFLEPGRGVDGQVAAGFDPAGPVHVDEQRLVSGAQDAVGREEKPGAAGPAQELAAGGSQQVAADLGDVDGVLADRLAGVD